MHLAALAVSNPAIAERQQGRLNDDSFPCLDLRSHPSPSLISFLLWRISPIHLNDADFPLSVADSPSFSDSNPEIFPPSQICRILELLSQDLPSFSDLPQIGDHIWWNHFCWVSVGLHILFDFSEQMGKAARWFKGLLGGGKKEKDKNEGSKSNLTDRKEKKRWSFGDSNWDVGQFLGSFHGSDNVPPPKAA